MWGVRGAGETQPCVWPTLRTNYGSGLSLFLATCPRGTVPAEMANHRVGGKRLAGDLGRMQNSSRRHGLFRGVTLGAGLRSVPPLPKKKLGIGHPSCGLRTGEHPAYPQVSKGLFKTHGLPLSRV